MIRWVFTSVLFMLLLQGCGSGIKRIEAPVISPAQRELADAGKLYRQQQYRQAAGRYRAIAATNSGDIRASALLGALRSLMKLRDLDAAQAVSAELSALPLNKAGLAEKLLFDGHISLETGDTETAMQTFDVIDEVQLAPLQRKLLHEDKARIYQQTGDHRAWVGELIILDPLLENPDRRLLNQQTILDQLIQLSDDDLDWLDAHGTPKTLSWTDLIRQARANLQDRATLDDALAAWRQQYPTHPLDNTLLEQFALRLLDSLAPPHDIAVLLPEHNRYAKAASIIRNGLRRAYQADQRADKPALTFHDSSDIKHLTQRYDQLADSGHDLIIGPLTKPAVARLAKGGLKPSPAVLALNRIDAEQQPANLFQFGLAPEDEASLAADRAWRDGHRVALTLTPKNAKGQRLRDAFARRFEALGGIVAESGEYDPKANEFTGAVKALLNIDASERRHKRLIAMLRIRLEFEPRPRPDAQCIFLVAKTMQARQINPLFNFYRAGGLPVYATSMLYNGRSQPELDIDLNGIYFTDIPALLHVEGNDEERDAPRDANAPLVRLEALGEDAYRLAQVVKRMAVTPDMQLSGRSGILYMDNRRRVHRLLVWARFSDGRPMVIGYATKPAEIAPEATEDAPSP